jgi:hypothetical protein
MLKRLVYGLVKGLLIGGTFAILMIQVLGVTSFGAIIGYLTALVLGAVTGLVAGKPIWKHGAKIEAGLKAAVGAGISLAILFAMRKWLPLEVDFSSLGAGKGALGELPVLSLPLISTFLAVVFELDNTDEVPATDERAAIAPPRQRVSEDDAELEADAELEDGRSQKVERKH